MPHLQGKATGAEGQIRSNSWETRSPIKIPIAIEGQWMSLSGGTTGQKVGSQRGSEADRTKELTKAAVSPPAAAGGRLRADIKAQKNCSKGEIHAKTLYIYIIYIYLSECPWLAASAVVQKRKVVFLADFIVKNMENKHFS